MLLHLMAVNIHTSHTESHSQQPVNESGLRYELIGYLFY